MRRARAPRPGSRRRGPALPAGLPPLLPRRPSGPGTGPGPGRRAGGLPRVWVPFQAPGVPRPVLRVTRPRRRAGGLGAAVGGGHRGRARSPRVPVSGSGISQCVFSSTPLRGGARLVPHCGCAGPEAPGDGAGGPGPRPGRLRAGTAPRWPWGEGAPGRLWEPTRPPVTPGLLPSPSWSLVWRTGVRGEQLGEGRELGSGLVTEISISLTRPAPPRAAQPRAGVPLEETRRGAPPAWKRRPRSTRGSASGAPLALTAQDYGLRGGRPPSLLRKGLSQYGGGPQNVPTS